MPSESVKAVPKMAQTSSGHLQVGKLAESPPFSRGALESMVVYVVRLRCSSVCVSLREQCHVQGKRSTLALDGTKFEGEAHLIIGFSGPLVNSVFSTATPTYFRSGRRVRDHTMAEIPPTISSSEGASPEDDQIPFST